MKIVPDRFVMIHQTETVCPKNSQGVIAGTAVWIETVDLIVTNLLFFQFVIDKCLFVCGKGIIPSVVFSMNPRRLVKIFFEFFVPFFSFFLSGFKSLVHFFRFLDDSFVLIKMGLPGRFVFLSIAGTARQYKRADQQINDDFCIHPIYWTLKMRKLFNVSSLRVV